MRVLLLAALLLAAPADATPKFSAERIKADVSFLADDLLEGRGTGARGHEIAARYVAAQFAVAGLKPGAKDGTWFQRVRLQERWLVGSAPAVGIAGPGGTHSFTHGKEAIVSASANDAATDITAPAVFVGYGFDAPAQGFDDYAGVDVRGKFVVVLDGIPAGAPNEVWAHLGRSKAAMAAARGAVGTISVQTSEAARRRPWARQVDTANVPRMTWLGPDGAPRDAGSAVRTNLSLDDDAATALFTGAPRSFADLRAAVDRGERPRGFALATTVHVTAHTAFRTLDSPEVIGLVPGRDRELRREAVLLMAHLDHLGIRPERSGDQIYNGALDNAAGVATMLEVARAMAAGPPPRRSVLFVANTAEEKGLLGAEAFADDPPVALRNLVAVVDLDQPLLLYDFTDIIAYGADHSTLGAAIARAAAGAGVRLSPDPLPAETIFVRSDHYALVKRGVPGVLLATGFVNGGEAAWRHYLATDYHQPSDDLKLPILWSAGAKYARVNYAIARELADARDRPRWYAHDYFGEAFASGEARAVRR